MAKVYSEKEASEILQKAVALQEAAGEAGESYTPGITAEELRKIAEEAGLDPKYLELALKSTKESEPPKKWFMNLVQEHERVIEGEIPPDSFDVILEGLSRNTQKHGLRQVGRAVEGQVSKGWGFGTLKLSSRRGRTRLSLRSNPFLPIMLSLYPCFMAGLIAAGVLAEQKMGLVGLGTFVGCMLLGYAGFRYGLQQGHQTFAKLADELESRVVQETEELRQELARPDSKIEPPSESTLESRFK